MIISTRRRPAWPWPPAPSCWQLLLVPFVLVRTGVRTWLTFEHGARLVIPAVPAAGQFRCNVAGRVCPRLGIQRRPVCRADAMACRYRRQAAAGRLPAGVRRRLLVALPPRRAPGEVPRGDWIYGLFLFAAPVINPWYALWLLPFAAIYPSLWAWTASWALFLSYITGLNLGDYRPGTVRPSGLGQTA